MSAPLLPQLKASPLLPELLQEAQAALLREQSLRQKFYLEVTPEHKWEFINGEVILHSPALHRHPVTTQRTYDLMSAYARIHKCGQVLVEKAMTCFPGNDYEPDIIFFGLTKSALISPDTLKFPIPDLIVEVISPATEARDRGVKLTDYASHGVAEYWIIDPVAETVELHRHAGDSYGAARQQSDGMVSSAVIPGFEIPVRNF